MNVQKMMKQVQKMQAEMMKVQEALAEKTVEGSAGGGAVAVTANGHLEIVAVKIDPAAVDPSDVEMLEDLVLTAVNDALKKAQEMASEAMAQVTGGLGLPGLPGF